MAGAVAGGGGGGTLLLASLHGLCDQMASRDVLAFLRQQKVSDGLQRKLKMKLLVIKGVLNDAEAKQMTDPDVNHWVDDVKDALYDAEDLLDDVATEALRCKMEPDATHDTDQVCNVKSRIDEITETLEYLAEQKVALGLKQGVVGEILSKGRMRSSLVDESRVCGRQDDIKKILDLLSSSSEIVGSSGNNNKTISVIALVGMGGIGKTTLAQLVYKDRSVVDCFDLKAWVCVSEDFDLVRLTNSILKAIPTSGAPPDDNDLNMLQCTLEEILNRKKFLLVLDDVWNENCPDFEKLLLPFNACHPGSKILVTTRSNEVARAMRSVGIHHVGELPFEDCWLLFARQAFENGDSSPHPKLEEIGKEIVRKCKGLPLAAKTLGAALYSELRAKQWEIVLNSKTWDFPNDEILPALRLSYSFLSPQLKRCFSYCSIFPKDYEFRKEDLILIWMAEGFLREAHGTKTMEEVGDGYFCDLVSRSFFQKSSNHKSKSKFVMHDLINDLAQLVFGKCCAQLKDGKLNAFPEKLRHLSYIRSAHDHFERFETLNEVSGLLRTFLPLDLSTSFGLDDVPKVRRPILGSFGMDFFLSNQVWNHILPKVQYLRVLSLCFYQIPVLPDSIGNLKHLRYLNLAYTDIERLPDSICCLYNLQTLILYRCQSLVELPQMMNKLISLRHLDIRNCAVKEMPSQMGELKDLQKLSNYIVGKQAGGSVGELRRLSHIGGSLVIQSLQNVIDGKDALEANLAGKPYLDELELEWEWDCDDQNETEVVLNKLRPHSNIKRLTIHGYNGSGFPNWLGGEGDPRSLLLLNMVSLRLWRCENVSSLPPLGQLRFLKHLYVVGLRGIERVGTEFYGIGPSFVSLKALSFHGMSKWKEWLCLGGGGQGGEPLFPRLKKLFMEDCPMLSGDLPLHLPLLTILYIERCEQLVAPLPRVPSIRILMADGRDISQWKELPPLLEYLSITNSDSLEPLFEEGMMQCNTSLKELGIRYCSFSRPLYRVCLPLTLTRLELEGCEKLEFLLPELFKCHLPLLEDLSIEKATVNSSLSMPLGSFPRLQHLVIESLKGLESLSISFSDGDLPSRGLLRIMRCPNLVSVCLKAACFHALWLVECPDLVFPIQGLPSSLTQLKIIGCIKFSTQMDFGVQPLPSLASLEISHFENHSSLDDMGLHLLTSLEELEIYVGSKLQSLTKEQLPTSLSVLKIWNCPLLGDRCQRGTGEYWPLISHIQMIMINGQFL